MWAYLAWSILPVTIAVWFSFNAGHSRSTWQGLSLRWYWGDPELSVWHDPDLHDALLHSLRLAVLTTLVAVPLGVAFAIGLDRWRGRIAGAFNFQMLLSFVMPEIILAVALLFLVTNLLKPLLAPAIFASAVLVFADVIDDVVLVRYLSSDAATEPMSVKIYSSARSSPTPALNALASIMLVSSLLAVALGTLVYAASPAASAAGSRPCRSW